MSGGEISTCVSRGQSANQPEKLTAPGFMGARTIRLRPPCLTPFNAAKANGRLPCGSYWFTPWHFLYFLPLPQGQGSLRPTLSPVRRCAVGALSPPPARLDAAS